MYYWCDSSNYHFLEALACWAVKKRVGVTHGDSTHVLFSFDLKVPLVSEGGAPAVLDVPEFHSVFCSVTCSKDSMIDILSGFATSRDAIDSSHIVLEAVDDLE